MPFKIISCDTCDFKASTTCLWGMFDYVSPDGARLDVNRTYGWCYYCQNICPVEDLSDEAKIKNDIDSKFQKIANIQNTGLIGKLLQLLGKNWVTINDLRKDIKNKQHRLTFLHERKSPPKCLVCSGSEIKKINLPNPQEENIDKIADIRHPNCGGNLLVQNSHYWINTVLPAKEYDLNGILLQENNPI